MSDQPIIPEGRTEERVPSPCVRNCCLDDQGICMGCERTLEEICAWHEASNEERLEVLARCRLRREQRPTPL